MLAAIAASLHDRVPGPRSLHPLGQLPQLRKHRLDFVMEMAMRYGDIARIRLGPLRAFVVTHPDAVRHILQDNHTNYSKATRGVEQLRLLLGDGLLTSDGAFWLRQRRIAQPAFHRQRIAGFGSAMVRATESMLERWKPTIRAGKSFDVASEMMRLTLQIVGETMFGSDVTAYANEVGDAISAGLEFFQVRIPALIDLPLWVPTPLNRKMLGAIRTLDRVVVKMVEERRRNPTPRNDLLDLLINARDAETGEAMNDKQLRDEVTTIFVAGHETTANALTWALYLLSLHPGVFERLRAELFDVLGDRAVTADDVSKLPYTLQVIEETMRLYPPAWLIARQSEGEDTLAGYRIPPKTLVFVSPYLTHRHAATWENPEGFDPDRFAPDRVKLLPRFAYFPFGGGPRLCIGNNFALMEAQLVLATMCRSVRLDVVPGQQIVPEPLVTLRPLGGIKMTPHAL